jgi:CRISPR-associated protein Cmr6
MAFYPTHKQMSEASRRMDKGNYGLWYDKLIPLNESTRKPSDENGDENMAVEHYLTQYDRMKKNAAELLKLKHRALNDYLLSFPAVLYEKIVIVASLKSPMITGIGESHPHEVSMVFDHNLGIPYIPASGVKGIVRFAHTISLLPLAEKLGKIEVEKLGEIEKDSFFNDEEPWTFVPMLFGTQRGRGNVIFLDAYPENVPDLHIDIMNPHYGPYYSQNKPPADHYNPTPIKFLTIKRGSKFIFRAIALKKDDTPQKVLDAFVNALTKEGVGAKTAVGYGRFVIVANDGKIDCASAEKPTLAQVPQPIEEVWSGAYVSFNAGGGGVIKVTAPDGRKAELSGRDKAREVTAPSLHKKLFDGKRNLPKADVKVRKVNDKDYEIVGVGTAGT